MNFIRRQARRAGLGLCMLLAACGNDGPEGNTFVQYDGRTLTVEGKPYEPADIDKAYPTLPGRVVVAVDGATDPEALDMVARYGIEIDGRSREGWLLLKVPEGFESQWATALTMQSRGRFFASTDTVSAPTVLFAPARKPVATDATVPTSEPSDADVKRAFFDRYERLEAAGGLPVTMTANGVSTVLRAKLYDARKESCIQLPVAAPGEWRCDAVLMVAICSGDCDPSLQEPSPTGERIDIRWDPAQRRFALGN
jgi:hypothetical protein